MERQRAAPGKQQMRKAAVTRAEAAMTVWRLLKSGQ
ncbi:MAG: hypothetical protein A4E53_02608 [Pelotomaculum sp. PtaB.Bin104]|nr:MAG: hypothetical protein A4E53_02608 [Pelotomaculum sp. PtaB.Bin104]